VSWLPKESGLISELCSHGKWEDARLVRTVVKAKELARYELSSDLSPASLLFPSLERSGEAITRE
jgi:hypothetical protein